MLPNITEPLYALNLSVTTSDFIKYTSNALTVRLPSAVKTYFYANIHIQV